MELRQGENFVRSADSQNLDPQKVSVSIILPCYKHEDVLDRSISSIVNQTVIPQELIVVNDGASLGVSQKISSFMDLYPNINIREIVLTKNLGASLARNMGWDQAIGKYIAFMDADDAWHPRKLEIQFNYMEENPDIFLCGHEYRQEAANQKTPDWKNYEISKDIKCIGFWRLLIVNQFITPSVMIKNVPIFRFSKSQTHMEDHQLWMCIGQSGKKIVKMKSELACIFKSPFGESGLSSNLWKMEQGEIQAYYSVCSQSIKLFPLLLLLLPYSLLKFARRLILKSIN